MQTCRKASGSAGEGLSEGSVWLQTGLFRFSAQSCKSSLKEHLVSYCPLALPQSLTGYILSSCAPMPAGSNGKYCKISIALRKWKLEVLKMCGLVMQKRAPEGVLELPYPTCRLSSSSWPECRSRDFPTCSTDPCVGSQAASFHITVYFWQLKLLTKSHPRVWEVEIFTFINWV